MLFVRRKSNDRDNHGNISVPVGCQACKPCLAVICEGVPQRTIQPLHFEKELIIFW